MNYENKGHIPRRIMHEKNNEQFFLSIIGTSLVMATSSLSVRRKYVFLFFLR